MSDIREIANPSDKITINCDDLDAARLAVIILSRGWYKIVGDDMPMMAMLGAKQADQWTMEKFGKTLQEWADGISEERIAAALESIANVGERTSMNDIVNQAHGMASNMRRRLVKP